MRLIDWLWVLALIIWALGRWTKDTPGTSMSPTGGFIGMTVLRVILLGGDYWQATSGNFPDESAILIVSITVGLMLWGIWLASIIRTVTGESNGWLAIILTIYLAINVYVNRNDAKHAFRAGLAGKPLVEAIDTRE